MEKKKSAWTKSPPRVDGWCWAKIDFAGDGDIYKTPVKVIHGHKCGFVVDVPIGSLQMTLVSDPETWAKGVIKIASTLEDVTGKIKFGPIIEEP